MTLKRSKNSSKKRCAKNCVRIMLDCVRIPQDLTARESFVGDLLKILHKGGHTLKIGHADVLLWVNEYEDEHVNFKYCPGKKIGRRHQSSVMTTDRSQKTVSFSDTVVDISTDNNHRTFFKVDDRNQKQN